MNDLIKHFKSELVKQLQTVEWMDEETRRRAVIKAKHINYKSGFPPYIFNESYMEKNWALASFQNSYANAFFCNEKFCLERLKSHNFYSGKFEPFTE